MKRSILIGALGLIVLTIVGFACGGGGDAPAAAAPEAAKAAAPAAAAATAVPQAVKEAAPSGAPAVAEGQIDESLPAVKIGGTFYLTGVAAGLGDEMLWAYDLAIDEANDRGGVHGGRRIIGLQYDEGYGAETVVASGKKALADGVVAVVGGLDATTCIPLMEIMKEKQMPLAGTTCGSEKMTTEGYHGAIHYTGPRNSLQWKHNMVAANARYLWGVGDRMAQVSTDSQYCRNVETELRKVQGDIEAEGGSAEFVTSLYFPYGAAEARIEVTKAISEKPDVLYFCQWGKQQVVSAIKAARELAFEGPIVVTVFDTPEAKELGDELAFNTYGAAPYYHNPEIAASVEFVNKLQPDYSGERFPTFITETYYTATTAMLMAIDKAGSTDSEMIRDAMYEVEFITPFGAWLTIDFKGQRRTPNTTLTAWDPSTGFMKVGHTLPFGTWSEGRDGGLVLDE